MRKNIAIFLFMAVIAVLQGCAGNDKDYIDCFTPPTYFRFNIVNENTGQNIFSEETINKSDIEIRNIDKNEKVEGNFIDGNNLNYIEISSIGWKTEKVNLMFKVKDKEIFTLYVDAERTIDNHCSFTKYHKIEIKGAKYEVGKNSVYTIKTDKF